MIIMVASNGILEVECKVSDRYERAWYDFVRKFNSVLSLPNGKSETPNMLQLGCDFGELMVMRREKGAGLIYIV